MFIVIHLLDLIAFSQSIQYLAQQVMCNFYYFFIFYFLTVIFYGLPVFEIYSFYLFQYALPSLQKVQGHLEVGNLDLSDTSRELFAPEEVEAVEKALATFTTGSTGMPKLLIRRHSFIMNQSKSLTMTFELTAKKELDKDEEDLIVCTNLPVFPLHYLKVSL